MSSVGGFELLWVTGPGRSLDVIQVPGEGYTAEYLKDVVRQAKIYIRPIQRAIQIASCPKSAFSVSIPY